MPADTSDRAVDGDATPPPANANEASVEPPLPPGVQDTHDEQTPPGVTPVTAPPLVAPQGEPLTLPATLPDGPAKFLNGEWRVNGGIPVSYTHLDVYKRQQQSRANVTRSFSPLSQLNPKPSEHHRWLLSPTATFPVCARFEGGISGLRSSSSAF